VEFWFDFGSNYSHLSLLRIEAAAAALRVAIAWRPFLLGPVFRALGWDSSPFLAQQGKLAYVWRDMEREARKYGLAWTRPSTFPRRAVLPLRVALVGADRPWIGAFCRRMTTLSFVEDRDIDDEGVVRATLESLDVPAGPVLAQALSDGNKLALRRQTEEAIARGIFGAPTFFVGNEMFWGNDRLDDALADAARG
jgi:2-hydroxychromene-2-carboxylate isomerase